MARAEGLPTPPAVGATMRFANPFPIHRSREGAAQRCKLAPVVVPDDASRRMSSTKVNNSWACVVRRRGLRWTVTSAARAGSVSLPVCHHTCSEPGLLYSSAHDAGVSQRVLVLAWACSWQYAVVCTQCVMKNLHHAARGDWSSSHWPTPPVRAITRMLTGRWMYTR